MSTTYRTRIRLTKGEWADVCAEVEWFRDYDAEERNENARGECWSNGVNWVWVDFPSDGYCYFTRYGRNDPEDLVDAFEAISEHDEVWPVSR